MIRPPNHPKTPETFAIANSPTTVTASMKSCLKTPTPSLPGTPTPSGSSTPPHCRKNVLFCEEGTEEIHFADEWDRTPSEPARRLSYQELLELKEIQQSLPHADQPADLLRPAKQSLPTVPIGLLPIFAPEHVTRPTAPSSEPAATPFVMPPGRSASRTPTSPQSATRLASPALTHLRPPAEPSTTPFVMPPGRSPSQAPPSPHTTTARPAFPFPFLPLLPADANTSSHSSDATYPPARAAAEGEADRFPSQSSTAPPTAPPAPPAPTQGRATGSRGGYEHAYRAAEAAAYSPPAPFGSSAYDYGAGRKRAAGSPPRGKRYMLINDVRVEIGGDDEDDDEEEEVEEVEVKEAEPQMKEEAEAPRIPIPSPATTIPIPIPPPTSPRLAASSPPTAAPIPAPARPLSPLTAAVGPRVVGGASAGGAVQARASPRLVRV